jgi:hypothetical protein
MSDIINKLREEQSRLYCNLQVKYDQLFRLEDEVKRLKYEIFRMEIDKCLVEHELGKELKNENKSNGN